MTGKVYIFMDTTEEVGENVIKFVSADKEKVNQFIAKYVFDVEANTAYFEIVEVEVE